MLDESLVRCVVGPLGSGKTMAMVMEILRRSRDQTPTGKIRYSRWAIVRNTLQQLKTTVLEDIRTYLGPMISYHVSDSMVRIRAQLADGTTIHSDWILMPLDTKEDVRRLLSMQLTGAWINETREVPIEVVTALVSRVGRYPSKIQGGPTWFGVILDTNPWDVDSAYHDKLVLNPAKNWKLFHQPSGIGPHAENADNLPPNYYTNLMDDRDSDWVEVHVQSQWGISNAGQAVFRRTFHPQTHVCDIAAIVNPHRPIMVMMDFGRTPCALIGQVDSLGRLIVFEEVVTEDMGLLMMVREKLKPVLFGPVYGGKRCFIVGDPAGGQKSQLREETAFDILRDEGFLAYPAQTNDIPPRLRAVDKLFLQTIQGEPALQISRTGCPTLVTALGSKYRYKKRNNGQLDELPEKLHPWSDVVDALQYGSLAVGSNLTARVLARDMPRKRNPVPRAAGWT